MDTQIDTLTKKQKKSNMHHGKGNGNNTLENCTNKRKNVLKQQKTRKNNPFGKDIEIKLR